MQYIKKKERKRFNKNYQCGLFSFVFVIKLGGTMTEIDRTTEDRQGPEDLTEFMTM